MNMTDRFNPANENDPKRKLAYGLIALACVIALGFGLDAASCSRTGTAGDEGGKQTPPRRSMAAAPPGATSQDGKEAGDEKKVEASPDPSRDLRRSVRGLRQALGHDRDKRESFCDAVASTMRANGYGLDEITVSIKKKPQATDNGTVVFMRVKGTGDCYSAHYADGTWTVFPLLERVDGVNDDLAQDQIDSRADTAADADATEQSAAAPKKTFAITDTEQAAKYIGDSCAGALMDAWRAFAAEKEGGADADSALFSRDHVTHNDDGTVTFTVWMPSSQKTYRGVADMAAGSVSFSE